MSDEVKDAGLVAMISSILGGNKRADIIAPPPLADSPPACSSQQPWTASHTFGRPFSPCGARPRGRPIGAAGLAGSAAGPAGDAAGLVDCDCATAPACVTSGSEAPDCDILSSCAALSSPRRLPHVWRPLPQPPVCQQRPADPPMLTQDICLGH